MSTTSKTKRRAPRKTSTATKPAATATPEQIDELAAHVAAVLNSPLTPAGVYNGLADALCGLDVPPGFTDSPAYLRALLAHHLAATAGASRA